MPSPPCRRLLRRIAAVAGTTAATGLAAAAPHLLFGNSLAGRTRLKLSLTSFTNLFGSVANAHLALRRIATVQFAQRLGDNRPHTLLLGDL